MREARRQQIISEFGSRVKACRAARGLTIRGLEAASGINRNTLVDIEHGRQSPTLNTVMALADALGVPFEALLVEPVESAAFRYHLLSAENRKLAEAFVEYLAAKEDNTEISV